MMIQKRFEGQVQGIELLDTQLPEFELGDIYDVAQNVVETHKGIYPKGHSAVDKPVTIVSNSYDLINHNEVFKTLKTMIAEKEYAISNVSIAHTEDNLKAFVTLLFDKMAEVKLGDTIQFGVQIANGVDGRMSLWAMPYTYRLICLNGNTIMKAMTPIKFKHIGIDMDDLKLLIANLLNGFDNIINKYKSWMDTEIIEMTKLSEEDNLWVAKNIPKKYSDKIVEAKPKSAWNLFNILTEANTFDKKRNEFTRLMFNNKIEKLVEIMTA